MRSRHTSNESHVRHPDTFAQSKLIIVDRGIRFSRSRELEEAKTKSVSPLGSHGLKLVPMSSFLYARPMPVSLPQLQPGPKHPQTLYRPFKKGSRGIFPRKWMTNKETPYFSKLFLSVCPSRVVRRGPSVPGSFKDYDAKKQCFSKLVKRVKLGLRQPPRGGCRSLTNKKCTHNKN